MPPIQNIPIRRRAFVGAALSLAAGGAAAFPWNRNVKPPETEAEYATERASAQGRFRVSYRAETERVPVGRLHAWTLQIAHADGTPVTGARVAVDGDMPEHGHGLPTRPRVTRELGGGAYLVEGVKFQMGGWWVMDFRVDAGGVADEVRFHLRLAR